MITDAEAKQLFCDMREGRKPFDAVCDVFLPVLMATSAKYLGSWADAEDVANMTLTETFKHRDDSKLKANPKAWLFRVLHNKITDVYRRRDADERLIRRFVVETDASHPPEINFDDDALYIPLRDCMSRLRPDLRDVIVRRYYEKRRFEELKTQMCLALGTLHKRLQNGLDSLGKCLKSKGVRSMSGSSEQKETDRLLKADARNVVQQITSAFKQTPFCYTSETLDQASKGKGMTDEMLSHIRGCRRCMAMAKIMGVFGAHRAEEIHPSDVLAAYLKELANSLSKSSDPVGFEQMAVGYYSERMDTETEIAEWNRYVDELMGLVSALVDQSIPVRLRTALIAKLHDLADEELKRKRSKRTSNRD